MTLEPTDEQYERAWRELAKDDWGTFAQVRAAARHYGLVRARAMSLASGRSASPATSAPAPAPSFMGSIRVPHQEPFLDRKRAASGEREDD